MCVAWACLCVCVCVCVFVCVWHGCVGVCRCTGGGFKNASAIVHVLSELDIASLQCRLKTYLRSAMKEDRLNGLVLFMVHPSLSISIKTV